MPCFASLRIFAMGLGDETVAGTEGLRAALGFFIFCCLAVARTCHCSPHVLFVKNLLLILQNSVRATEGISPCMPCLKTQLITIAGINPQTLNPISQLLFPPQPSELSSHHHHHPHTYNSLSCPFSCEFPSHLYQHRRYSPSSRPEAL